MTVEYKTKKGGTKVADFSDTTGEPVAGLEKPLLMGKVVLGPNAPKEEVPLLLKKGGQGSWQVVKPDKTMEVQHEDLPLPIITGPVAEVGVQMGQTISLGNFEFVRVDVSVKLPCGVGELDDTYEFAENWVDTKMKAMITQINKAKEGA